MNDNIYFLVISVAKVATTSPKKGSKNQEQESLDIKYQPLETQQSRDIESGVAVSPPIKEQYRY